MKSCPEMKLTQKYVCVLPINNLLKKTSLVTMTRICLQIEVSHPIPNPPPTPLLQNVLLLPTYILHLEYYFIMHGILLFLFSKCLGYGHIEGVFIISNCRTVCHSNLRYVYSQQGGYNDIMHI